jgi:hypothetical protein
MTHSQVLCLISVVCSALTLFIFGFTVGMKVACRELGKTK